MPQTPLLSILGEFRSDALNNRDLGDKFERLIASYLTTDPQWANRFGNKVWLWQEWPGRNKQPDTGVDLVAEDINTGEIWAIQCKFFLPEHSLQKSDIDSFFTASGRKPFSRRMIVSTTDKWGKHAEAALRDQSIPTTRLGVQDLEESSIDWAKYSTRSPHKVQLRAKKALRPHQQEALDGVAAGFSESERGKLIMACGTGKTFTSLKIAESTVPAGGTVLFLVPSISLLSQTLREWTAESERPLVPFAVCSDAKVAKQQDAEDMSVVDLAFPAHTNARKLGGQFAALTRKSKGLTVIFSTYQSISVVSEAQRHGLPEFDLVICDEAHRTTGVGAADKEASAFVRVHDGDYLKSRKRLYMTATPRIYSDASKGKAKDAEVTVYSMDDEAHYGPEFHRLDFSEAVRRDLLTDYKVLVLAVDEGHVSSSFQGLLSDKNNELNLDDAVKLTGCWNGLNKRLVHQDEIESKIDLSPMRRAVAFCDRIQSSKLVRDMFPELVDQYLGEKDSDDLLRVQVGHVDGSMNALERNSQLAWLREDSSNDGNVCRILTNARCLSEGVDVPALDAVMFLNPRKSVVDVVQAVGRVMRKAKGKDLGYIILPIGVPVGMEPHEALANNEKYKVVWQVLQALRAHDDRFNATINKLELNEKKPQQIGVIGVGDGRNARDNDGEGQSGEGGTEQRQFAFPNIEQWRDAIFAKIVIKCGSRTYWETWAKDVADIASRHISRITTLLEDEKAPYSKEFSKFLKGLQVNLNPAIGKDDAIEMLAQHLITKPVFDALFEGYDFSRSNPVSKTMQKMLDVLDDQSLDKETQALEGFYASVRERAAGIDNAEARQKVIVDLYEKFFKQAFKRTSERLGIVYTPVEVVDFILRTADDALKSEFGLGLTDENVHILDPFTGTGTFMVRLLQSGIIADKDLPRKFRKELHANELVLLAYYIAAINIEEAYHGRTGSEYEPFEGILLTDTFQLSEADGGIDAVFPVNTKRGQRQRKQSIRVIVGNPPYSAWQQSANDGNQNLKYDNLDDAIRNSYVANSPSTNNNSLYDSYIRSIRWATDRLGESGIICYVSNGSFIDNNAMAGLRKCLCEDFSAIYVFNLRGNQRTSGELSRQEGGKIFGSGSRAQIAITLFVKNPSATGDCQIQYHDIGDYLTREQKLDLITEFGSYKSLPFEPITPNSAHDWINQRDPAFEHFMPIGDKETKGRVDTESVFVTYSSGVKTGRDAWAHQFSKSKLRANMKGMIEFFNSHVEDFKRSRKAVEKFIDRDAKRISWSANAINDVSRGKNAIFDESSLTVSFYRPFCKQNFYYHRQFNERVYRMPAFFPKPDTDNLVICVSGPGSSKDFSALISDTVPDLEVVSKSQCFPLYTFQDQSEDELALGDSKEGRQVNVSDYALKEFQSAYGDTSITKKTIFYYVYGVLHSPEYKKRFKADLKKMLPRIPKAKDFWAFSNAGRELAEIHLGYESAEPFPVKEHCESLRLDPWKLYRVEKMRFAKSGKREDKSAIIYNNHITFGGIPEEAYEYVVNGKPAIEWVMERYQSKKEKASGIINDPNDWSRESDDPCYIPNLLRRVISVSLETVKIVKSLPPLHELDR